METRIAVMGIIVEDRESAELLNDALHEYGSYIIGRIGIPHHKKHMNIISIIVDAPNDIINALSGKIGKIKNVTVKTAYSGVVSQSEE